MTREQYNARARALYQEKIELASAIASKLTKFCKQCQLEKLPNKFSSQQNKCNACRRVNYQESHKQAPDNELIPPGPGVITHRAGDTHCQTGHYQGHRTGKLFASPLEKI